MTDFALARILRSTYSDKEYYAFVDWAQGHSDHMIVRAELARIKDLMEAGRL